jgi:hypothetical protein
MDIVEVFHSLRVHYYLCDGSEGAKKMQNFTLLGKSRCKHPDARIAVKYLLANPLRPSSDMLTTEVSESASWRRSEMLNWYSNVRQLHTRSSSLRI